MSTSSLMSKTAASKTPPSWNTDFTNIWYSNGLIPSFVSKTAALGDTFSPAFKILNSLTSSICPLTILVPMFKAWKKDVCDGSIPVGPLGSAKSTLDSCPDFAPELFLCLPTICRISSKEEFVLKMKPTLPFMFSFKVSRPASGCCSCPMVSAFRIMVFLPINTTAFPRNSMRISCICFEATLSTVMMRAAGVLMQRSMSLSKYFCFLAIFSSEGMSIRGRDLLDTS
mmetsp:Transcript_38593/g.76504  ORF Transcript_38593/g.76504 Transcript_38593/m.76504 type:complete len:227 (-) Transcript_38593:32-712(-)